jgi:DNA-binding transcriptional regulator YbjK
LKLKQLPIIDIKSNWAMLIAKCAIISRFISYLLLIPITATVYAIPVPTVNSAPVVDTQKRADDIEAYALYAMQLGDFIHQLSDNSSIKEQLSSLSSLLSAQDSMQHICNRYCSVSEEKQLKQYLADINGSILARFNDYANSLNTHVTTLNELARLLAASVSDANTKNIGLSLQKASQVSLTQISDVLQQIQSTLVLNSNKQQVENKLERANNEAIYNGFARSGL